VCVEQAIRTGLALGATINRVSKFDRKNYFYPDLPAGYQISQLHEPIVGRGRLMLVLPDGSFRQIGIRRLHLEQDAGRSVHLQEPTVTLVDLNRAGVALMEIVSEPDLRSGEEAGAFVRTLRSMLQHLGTCHGDMENGSLRCDCNVSVRKPGEPLGTRCEIKNLNSIRFVMQAVECEARRQIEVLENGGRLGQETRLYDSARNETRVMRSKEEAQDYRYFPEPDLLTLVLDQSWIEAIRGSLPELPNQKRERFIIDYGLAPYDADVLVAEPAVARFFEEAAQGRDARQVARWITGELFGLLNRDGVGIEDSRVSAGALGRLIDLVFSGSLSGKLAKDVLAQMLATGADPDSIVRERGLVQVSDPAAIASAVERVFECHPELVTQYRAGKTRVFGFFVGQVMQLTDGRANPSTLNQLLRARLDA
jgi:aspartyl-tRNA(Asn)/glutamyl-tRNA(Gln) amidotransferase subunit B